MNIPLNPDSKDLILDLLWQSNFTYR